MDDITYQYALTEDRKSLVDINDVTKEDRENNTYYCLSCEKPLIPKLGDVKAHHFAHYSDEGCSKETYLHRLGKFAFYLNYILCLQDNTPIYLEENFIKECDYYFKKFKQKCNYNEDQRFNLIELFPHIEYQKKVDDFIPDLVIYDKNKKDKIFIEIFVTHRVSYEKATSGIRIIEISIQDESDIELIKQNLLSYRDYRLKFYNIQQKTIKASCNGNCKKSYWFIFLSKNGSILQDKLTLNELENADISEYYILEEQHKLTNDIYKWFAGRCGRKNLNVLNCNICKYNMPDKYQRDKEKPIFCKLYSYTCSSTEAENCKGFLPMLNIIKSIDTSFPSQPKEVIPYKQLLKQKYDKFHS